MQTQLNSQAPKPLVWSIAGSDCTAGAGIQADVKAIHCLDGLANTVITAVTAQNHTGVIDINAVTIDVLTSQIEALIQADIEHSAEQFYLPNVIKVGLLANAEQVEFVADFIAKCKNHLKTAAPLVVYDPVLSASNGGQLTEDNLVEIIKIKLLPFVDVITPNADEVKKFTGVYMFSADCMLQAAKQFQSFGCKAAVIKGGHIEIEDSRSIDLGVDLGLYSNPINRVANELTNNTKFDKSLAPQTYWLNGHSVDSEHSHGTGCTFASALATLLGHEFHFRDAITIAKAFITDSLEASKNITLKSDQPLIYGPVIAQSFPSALELFPQTSRCYSTEEYQAEKDKSDRYSSEQSPRASYPSHQLQGEQPQIEHSNVTNACGFKRLDKRLLSLYPVVPDLVWLERLLKAGIKTIQYREKSLQGDDLDASIEKAVCLGKQYHAQLFINDHWQLAIKHNAFGIHLGQEDVQSADLEAIKAEGLCLGISTHGHFEFLSALKLNPSYLAIGAIFQTQTKDMTGQIQGIQTLQRLCELQQNVPIVAIGGITLDNAHDVLQAGADSIAVVTAITQSADPELAIDRFFNVIKTHQYSC